MEKNKGTIYKKNPARPRPILSCKDKIQQLLTFPISSYCVLALQDSVFIFVLLLRLFFRILRRKWSKYTYILLLITVNGTLYELGRKQKTCTSILSALDH